MYLSELHINQQFQKNHRQHVFAAELTVKIQRLRLCFLENTLPLPSAKMTTAWRDLPNITVDNLPMSMKTEVTLRTPPPTPLKCTFADGPISSDPTSNGSHGDDDLSLVDDIASTTSTRTLEGAAPSEGDSKSQSSHPDQSLDGRTKEGESIQSTDNSLSSDQESMSSGSGASTLAGFYNTVNQWLWDYHARGTEAFIETLIAFAVTSVGSAILASRIARAMVKKLMKTSHTEGKCLESTIRFSMLAVFKKYWEPVDRDSKPLSGDSAKPQYVQNGDFTEMPSTQANMVPPISHGITMASFMGSLFNEKMSTAKDIYLCLSLLSEGGKGFDRLCAMHALLVQANDKLCKNRNLAALVHFKDDITAVGKESGEYLWAADPRSKIILVDILATIERWSISQGLRREQGQISSGTDNRTIRKSAVGPRLRRSAVAIQAGL